MPASGRERVFASPLARRLAGEQGLDLAQMTGSGPGGRVVARDVEARSSSIPSVPSRPPAMAGAGMPAYEEVPLTPVRRIIAERLAEAKRTVPHFYLTIDCILDKLLELRDQLNARIVDRRISVNDFVLRACALALRKVPAANASFTKDAIRLYRDVDIAFAVATEGGLFTPIVRHADHKGLDAISRESAALIDRARRGRLVPEDFQGGTFSISNLGMMGVRQFEAIVNPPQACILAVGAAQPRPVVMDGALAVATVMTVTLSVDHRAVDGADGARFLAAFKELVEEPMTMLL